MVFQSSLAASSVDKHVLTHPRTILLLELVVLVLRSLCLCISYRVFVAAFIAEHVLPFSVLESEVTVTQTSVFKVYS